MSKILITGANGYIGKHIIQNTLKKNMQVCALDMFFNKNLKLVTQCTEDILTERKKHENTYYWR